MNSPKLISQPVASPTVVGGNIRTTFYRSQSVAKSGDVPTGLSNKILSQLPALELKRLLPYLEPVSLARHSVLQRSKSEDFVYFPESAVISQLYLLKNGGVTEAAMIGSEGLIGLSAILGIKAPPYSLEVIIGGYGLRVNSSIVKQEFERGRDLHRFLVDFMSKRLSQVSQRAVCNGRHQLSERLCTWLLMLSDRVAEGVLPLTHMEIAESLGSRRSVITSCSNNLRMKGLIGGKRGEILILDRERLEASACECYQVLKQNHN